jgi:monothiol glutaredoxin
MSQQTDHDRIRTLVAGNDVVLFMKGTKNSSQCGFSDHVAQILQQLGVDYKEINVLDDATVRDGIKSYTNWPTIPQLYVKGEFVGGCDIVREMFQSGDLQKLLNQKSVRDDKHPTPRDLESWVYPYIRGREQSFAGPRHRPLRRTTA